ncbi:MAG: alpha-glucosidase [Clostridia bacterium]|nr:alpha-glucosidase [Clostridia bacterium]
MKFDHRFRLLDSGPSVRVYEADGIAARLDVFAHILRVAIVRQNVPLLPTWSVCPDGNMPLMGRDKLSTDGFALAAPTFTEDENALSFTLDGVRFSVELCNFRITASTDRGILYRDRSGLAYNFAGELGRGSAHYTVRFEGQRIFGLGDKCGPVDKANRRFQLAATDSMGFSAAYSDPLYKQIPFYICSHAAGSYGLYYDTYSNGTVDFGAEHDNYFEPFHAARFDEENLVFYLILGTPLDIIRRFNALCGGIAPVPQWAFCYCGSTMEYTDAPDADARLKGFLTQCEQNGIRPGGFYLSSGYTQIGERRCVFHWNTDKIPSPEALAAHFDAHGVRLIPNVKPAFLTDHPLYDRIAKNGWFLHFSDGTPARFPFWGGMASYLDFTNPDAYAFWKDCVKRQLVEKGYRHIWNDNNEYGVQDESVLANGFGTPVPACRIRPLFSYLMARASREACLEAGVEEPFNVSRCAIAGTQRVASTWTGDNFTSFEELRANHKQAMTMALSGFLFFGPDIGGFAGPKPSEELFLRWLQYGVFLPRFTLHSWKPGEPSTMPWLYPELLPAVTRLFDLRETLVPYLYAEAERCRKMNEPLIRPVFLTDPAYDPESDCFLSGERILVCPVFDEGAGEITVTLPRFGVWRLRGEGAPHPSGETLTVPCLPSDLPVWFTRD